MSLILFQAELEIGKKKFQVVDSIESPLLDRVIEVLENAILWQLSALLSGRCAFQWSASVNHPGLSRD